MSEWNPIETAPKDGSWVIGYRPERSEDRPQVVAMFYYFDTETEIVDLGNDTFRRIKHTVGKWFDHSWSEFEPTHWHSLTPLPE